jgi:hypothetical protein
MGATTLAVRCPVCGQELRAVVTPSPPTQWFPCPHCRSPVPVVVPRDPPPLYSWEVLPNLYPPLPRPRVPRWRARRAVAGALIGVVVLAGVFGGVLSYYGIVASTPGSYPVTGTVDRAVLGGGVAPAVGATVTLTEEGGRTLSETTALDGSFSFSGVPTGGIALNVSLSGYAPVTVDTFASSVYDAGTTGILVTLGFGSVGNGTTMSLTPFTNLESFLASIGSGIVLLGLVAVVAAVAAVLTLRQDRPALGVIGGGAGLLAPLALYLLALATPFPAVIASSAILAALGGFALAIRAAELGQTGPAEGSD